jgi:excisionase family DNA binding protein
MSRARPHITREDIPPRSAGDAKEDFLTIEDTAAGLDVSTRTVRRWIDHGELPVHRIGRIVRIARTDLVAFLARHRVD